MKLTENYPIYLNPDFNEIQALAHKGWDTIRICLDCDTGDILLASGYGNTHTSMYSHYIHEYPKRRRHFLDCFILWKSGNKVYLNTEDIVGGRMEDNRLGRYFSEDHCETLRDLISASDLLLG